MGRDIASLQCVIQCGVKNVECGLKKRRLRRRVYSLNERERKRIEREQDRQKERQEERQRKSKRDRETERESV